MGLERATLCSRFFVWRFVTALSVTDIQRDSYSWPLFVYMGTSCVYPFASSCAHTFSSMSRNARHICYFLDYGAVNLFSLGTWGPCLLPSLRLSRLPLAWELGSLQGLEGLAEESRESPCLLQAPDECFVRNLSRAVLANTNRFPRGAEARSGG